ncbi:MAG: replicative DNA helicase [Candidatus Deferrimicrobiaceae bacterium]
MNRQPPADLRMETAVLAAALLVPEAALAFADALSPADFYADRHAAVAGAVVALVAEREPVDTTTVRGRLEAQGTLSRVGDEALLALTDGIPEVERVESYAKRLRQLAQLRRWIAEAHKQTAAAYGPIEDVDAFLDGAEAAMSAVTADRATGLPLVPMATVVEQVIADVTVQSERGTHMVGHATGLQDFDEMTLGLAPGELVIVAARPGMGKTAFAMNNVAAGIASRHIGQGSLPVVVFSCEMPASQLVGRTLASESGVDLQRIRSANLTREDWESLVEAAGRLMDLPIYFHPVTNADVIAVRRQSRRAAREHGTLGAVVVDYLQLMQTHGGDNRDQQLGQITRGLKQLALELECPIVLLSQLNREVEKRQDKRPLIADLRESGNIEQDADKIVFIYRDEVYNPESSDKGLAELILRKNRSGPVGTVRAMFRKERTRFENFDSHHEEGHPYAGDFE